MTILMPPQTWAQVCESPRWMPIGTARDPKAPAVGYRSNSPAGDVDNNIQPWLAYGEVYTALAGLNFGPADGLIGLDLDAKPELAQSPDDVAAGRRLCGVIANGLPACPAELSHSGRGVHLFGWADFALIEWLAGVARRPITLVPGRERKAAYALEVFGGGNAYIAVTGRWIAGRSPNAEPLPQIRLAELQGLCGELWPASDQPRLPAPPPASDEPNRLLGYLLQIPVPADYDDWLKLASAAVNAGIAAAQVEAWSAGGRSYKPGEIMRRAAKDTLLGRPSAGYVVEVAKAHGVDVRRGGGRRVYEPPPEPVSDWQPWMNDSGGVTHHIAPPESDALRAAFGEPTAGKPTTAANLCRYAKCCAGGG